MKTSPQLNPPLEQDWEEMHRLLIDRHETFVFKLCEILGLPQGVTGDNDILETLQERFNDNKLASKHVQQTKGNHRGG